MPPLYCAARSFGLYRLFLSVRSIRSIRGGFPNWDLCRTLFLTDSRLEVAGFILDPVPVIYKLAFRFKPHLRSALTSKSYTISPIFKMSLFTVKSTYRKCLVSINRMTSGYVCHFLSAGLLFMMLALDAFRVHWVCCLKG